MPWGGGRAVQALVDDGATNDIVNHRGKFRDAAQDHAEPVNVRRHVVGLARRDLRRHPAWLEARGEQIWGSPGFQGSPRWLTRVHRATAKPARAHSRGRLDYQRRR